MIKSPEVRKLVEVELEDIHRQLKRATEMVQHYQDELVKKRHDVQTLQNLIKEYESFLIPTEGV